GLPLAADELPLANDFVAPALYFDRFRAAALAHLGGSPDTHDAALFNRLTGATYATHLALVEPGVTVVGVSTSTASWGRGSECSRARRRSSRGSARARSRWASRRARSSIRPQSARSRGRLPSACAS